jgi:murein DD-endopeptidase MepM/ murein hydrolase activator NlpD
MAVALLLICVGCERRPRAAPVASPPPDEAPTETAEPAEQPPAGEPVERELQSGETLATALAAAGLSADEATRVIAALREVDVPFARLRPGQTLSLWTDEAGACTALNFHLTPALSFQVRRRDGELAARRVELPVETRVVKLGARVETSVYEAILQHGETDDLASLVSQLFAWDVDFYTDPRVGDTFKLIFEKTFLPDGKPYGYGRLLAGEYNGEVTGKKRGYWVEDSDPDARGFYDERGRQMRKTFLVAPLDTMRVTSRFGMRRHPVLGGWRMHGGVDYGARTGTPVWAVADGQVVGAGGRGAAGNMVKIEHGGGLVTMYLHLSRIAVRSGQRVHQRQLIGRVGATGRVTGPHLDFRVQQNNKPINPQKLRMIATPLRTLPADAMPKFEELMNEFATQLELIEVAGGAPTRR